MSELYRILRKKNYYQKYIFPRYLQSKDLIKKGEKVYAVIEILSPRQNKEDFFKKSHFGNLILKYNYPITEQRMNYIVILMGLDDGFHFLEYNPSCLVNLYCYKNSLGKYDREEGFDLWMMHFSSYFVSRESVILDLETYKNFINSFNGPHHIKRELEAISGLLTLQYK